MQMIDALIAFLSACLYKKSLFFRYLLTLNLIITKAKRECGISQHFFRPYKIVTFWSVDSMVGSNFALWWSTAKIPRSECFKIKYSKDPHSEVRRHRPQASGPPDHLPLYSVGMALSWTRVSTVHVARSTFGMCARGGFVQEGRRGGNTNITSRVFYFSTECGIMHPRAQLTYSLHFHWCHSYRLTWHFSIWRIMIWCFRYIWCL
jgi:hypothetical protein